MYSVYTVVNSTTMGSPEWYVGTGFAEACLKIQHVTRTPASVSIRLIAKAVFDSSASRNGARTKNTNTV
jgi:hypothetical protein